jgi:hypothetical protein
VGYDAKIMEEAEFFSIVEILCRSPRVHTQNGSFLEVIMFLEGYALGANVGDNCSHSKFTPFLQWVAIRYKKNKSCINWDEFQEIFTNEAEAFSNLISLYKTYTESDFLNSRLGTLEK